MKKSIFIAAIAVLSMGFASCSSNSAKTDATEATTEVAAISVDDVLANAEKMVGDTVTIEGVCSHLCRQGGKKAFVAGSADSIMIRCEAYPLMGEPFPKSTIHHPIQVRGILCEERVDEDAIQEMVRIYTQAQQPTEDALGTETPKQNAESGCETERAAKGQKDLVTFEQRIADYRAKIAARQEKEGKSYLSYYYIQAISYDVLPE